MKIYNYPSIITWKQILQRPVFDSSSLQAQVKLIMKEVKQNGDAAIQQFSQQFDGVLLNNFILSQTEIWESSAMLSIELKGAIEQAAVNIRLFHEKQVAEIEVIENMAGVKCWRKSIGIEKVGLYIPGGTAPLFSTILMLGIPAKIAGCKEIIMCTPPGKDGKVPPAILFAAQLVGITDRKSVV